MRRLPGRKLMQDEQFLVESRCQKQLSTGTFIIAEQRLHLRELAAGKGLLQKSMEEIQPAFPVIRRVHATPPR
jgi:hypothetical protein